MCLWGVVWCVCECVGCGTAWCAENLLRAHVPHTSVCSFKTTQCVAVRRLHVFNMRASCCFTRRRFETTQGGVLDMSTGGGGEGALSLFLSVLASFFTSFSSSSLFSLLFSPSFLFSSRQQTLQNKTRINRRPTSRCDLARASQH